MDEKQIDDVVAMIDQFMSNNGGHMNIESHGDGKKAQIKTMNSLDCATGNLACQVPTLFHEKEEESL